MESTDDIFPHTHARSVPQAAKTGSPEALPKVFPGKKIGRGAAAPYAARPILQVTPSQVEAKIASEHYYTGAQGMAGVRFVESTPHIRIPPQLAGVMHCTLICKNGQIVTGEAFCADLDNPDHEAARQSARRRAFDKLYDMVVYEARSQCLATSK